MGYLIFIREVFRCQCGSSIVCVLISPMISDDADDDDDDKDAIVAETDGHTCG